MPKKSDEKEFTNNQLAIMIEKLGLIVTEGFDHVDKSFGEVDNKLIQLEQRLETKIDNLALMTKEGFDAVDQRFNGVEKRLHNLEQDREVITRIKQALAL